MCEEMRSYMGHERCYGHCPKKCFNIEMMSNSLKKIINAKISREFQKKTIPVN